MLSPRLTAFDGDGQSGYYRDGAQQVLREVEFARNICAEHFAMASLYVTGDFW